MVERMISLLKMGVMVVLSELKVWVMVRWLVVVFGLFRMVMKGFVVIWSSMMLDVSMKSVVRNSGYEWVFVVG